MQTTTRKSLANREVEVLSAMISKRPELITLVQDVMLTKDIINSVQAMLISGINGTIREGGWEQLIAGSETNENLVALMENPSLILYSQLLMALVLAVADLDPDRPLQPTD